MVCLGIVGMRERVEKLYLRKRPAPETIMTLLAGGSFLLVFGGACVLTGQIKANWVLPALVVFWPAGSSMRKLRRTGWLAIPILLSVGQAIVMNYPLMLSIPGLGGLNDTYTVQAGLREARVSTTTTWQHHLLEYHGIAPFFQKIRGALKQIDPSFDQPRWIVSDDYGLASQVFLAWDQPDQRLVIPSDPIFSRSVPDAETVQLAGGALVLAVHGPVEEVWPRLEGVVLLVVLKHPVTGGMVHVGIAEGYLEPEDNGLVSFQ